MSSTFIISLDFELHWGGFEKWPAHEYRKYFLNTRTVIPEMLNAFRSFDVHVTRASVGMLFHSNREELLKSVPDLKPTYNVPHLTAYHYMDREGIGGGEEDDPLHFAGSLVNQIVETPGQELGSHSFAHYYCNEAGQTLDQFRADLQAAQRAAERYGQKLQSLVFPRNQFNEDYLRVCFEEGFIAVRDNPRDWFWNIQSTLDESMW
jgi:peptidoglycan/xylan/chitin deacetylase (PgdA/CDA1 family)